jgi:hypothetical protein
MSLSVWNRTLARVGSLGSRTSSALALPLRLLPNSQPGPSSGMIATALISPLAVSRARSIRTSSKPSGPTAGPGPQRSSPEGPPHAAATVTSGIRRIGSAFPPLSETSAFEPSANSNLRKKARPVSLWKGSR